MVADMVAPITEWTEPRVAQLSRLWSEGWSASIIARKIGGTTRNAVIGKVHRLGLESRLVRVRITPNRTRIKSRQATSWQAKAFQAETTPARQEPVSMTLPLADLTEHTCRWPHGDPKSADFGFCGHPVAPGSSYCAHHHRKART